MRPLLRLVLPLALLGASAHAQPASPLRVIRATPTGDAPPTRGDQRHLRPTRRRLARPHRGPGDRPARRARGARAASSGATRSPCASCRPRRSRRARATPSPSRTAFRAMDGSALAEPYRFTFRVAGPALLAGTPGRRGDAPRTLVPDAALRARVLRAGRPREALPAPRSLEFSAACAAAQRIVRLRAAGQRAVARRRRVAHTRGRRLRSAIARSTPCAASCSSRRRRRCRAAAPASSSCRRRCEDERLRDPARWAFETYGDSPHRERRVRRRARSARPARSA